MSQFSTNDVATDMLLLKRVSAAATQILFVKHLINCMFRTSLTFEKRFGTPDSSVEEESEYGKLLHEKFVVNYLNEYLVVIYARSFTQMRDYPDPRNLPGERHPLIENIKQALEPDELHLHNLLLKVRNKMLAHTDMAYFEPYPNHLAIALGGPAPDLNWSDKQLLMILLLCTKWADMLSKEMLLLGKSLEERGELSNKSCQRKPSCCGEPSSDGCGPDYASWPQCCAGKIELEFEQRVSRNAV